MNRGAKPLHHKDEDAARRRLLDAIDGAREGVVLVDRGGRIVSANRQAAAFFAGVAPHLAPGADFAAAFGERCAELERGEMKLGDGRWLRLSRSATAEGGFLLVASDITEMKERERRLKEAQEQAEAASRAKSSFLANMSHELRTPLNAIIGFAEVMAGQMFGALGSRKYVQYSADIVGSGRHLLGIINSVLDLAKSEAGKLDLAPEAVDLGEVLASCLTMVREQCARAELTLEVEEPQDALIVLGDASKLRQVFLNLLSNAMKFTEPGGTVSLAVRRGAPDWISVIVADTGIGMTPEDVRVALSPFGQVDSRLARRYEGTGLGLPLAKALAELHGGVLVIDSEPGKGTQVTVALQLAASSSALSPLPLRAAS
jgi:signal transduction histidine kinase